MLYTLIIHSSNCLRKEKIIICDVGHGLSVLFSLFISILFLIKI